jgi:hypothetical protein
MECNLTPIIFLYSLSYSMPSRYLSWRIPIISTSSWN